MEPGFVKGWAVGDGVGAASETLGAEGRLCYPVGWEPHSIL